MWEIKIINDWKEIWSDRFQFKWNELLMTSPTSHVFFHPVVAKAWIDTYLPLRKIEPVFIWGEKDGNQVLLPLVMWHKNWKNAFVKSIIPVGYSDYDYHNPLFRYEVSQDELSFFWSELLASLTIIGADEICIDGITDACAQSGDGWRQVDVCPSLSISEMTGAPDLMTFLSAKLRGDIRRQMRRLNEVAPLAFREFACGKDVPDAVFDDFMAAHSKKWPNAYKAPGFYRKLIDNCSLEGPIHFSTLNVGDTVVAWHLGFDFKDTYYYYLPAGNPEYLKFSPVKVHLYHLIIRAIEKNYTRYDHLRGSEPYKSGWADCRQNMWTLYLSRNNIFAKFKLAILNIKKVVKE